MDHENEKEKNGLTGDDRMFLKSLEKLYTGWAFFVETLPANTDPKSFVDLMQPSILVGWYNPLLLNLSGGIGIGEYMKMFNTDKDTSQTSLGPPATWRTEDANPQGFWVPYTVWMPLYMGVRSSKWWNTISFSVAIKAVFAYRPDNM